MDGRLNFYGQPYRNTNPEAMPEQNPTPVSKAVMANPSVISMLKEAALLGLRGMMYHGDMHCKVHLMGLNGHKRLHRYECRNDANYFMDIRDFAIDMFGEDVDPMPSAWPMDDVIDVKSYLLNYLAYEEDTYRKLCNISNRLVIAEYVYEASMVKKNLHCVEKEIEKIRRMLQAFELVNWDMSYILLHDRELHEKMKCKEAEHQGYKG